MYDYIQSVNSNVSARHETRKLCTGKAGSLFVHLVVSSARNMPGPKDNFFPNNRE